MMKKGLGIITTDGMFAAFLLLVLVFHLVPVWAVAWLPMGDVGGHIELMDIVARYHDPATIYSDYYRLGGFWDPNSLNHKIAWLIGPQIGVAATAKLIISGYVVALPLGMLSMCLAHGRSRWLVFLCCPMTFSALFNVGFLDFLVSLPLLFFAIALSRSFAERGGWVRMAGLTVLLILLFFAHIISFLIGFGICLVQLVLWLPNRRATVHLTPLAVSLPLFLAWTYRKIVLVEGTEVGRTMGSLEEGLRPRYQPFGQLVDQIYDWGMQFFRDYTDEIVSSALLAIWLVFLVMSWRRSWRLPHKQPSASWSGRLRAHTLDLVTVCCAIAYFALPSDIADAEVVTQRVVMIFFLLLALAPRLSFRRWFQIIPLAASVGVALVYPWVVTDKFVTFEEEYLGNLREAIADLPDRTRLSYVQWEQSNSVTHMGPLWHIPKAIHSLENGGITDDSFAFRPTCSIQYREGMTPHRLKGRFWLNPHMWDYDYILLRSSRRPDSVLRQSSLGLTFHENIWWLFEVAHELEPPGIDEIPTFGGGGGSPVYWDCPTDTLLRGFRGQANRYLENLTPVCTPIPEYHQDRIEETRPTSEQASDPALQRIERVRTFSAQSDVSPRDLVGQAGQRRSVSGPQFGDSASGHSRFEALCGLDEVVVGLHGRFARYVDRLGVICAPVDGLRRSASDVETSRTPAFGGSGGEPFQYLCPDSHAARGFYGRAGTIVDAVGIACTPVP